MSDGKTTIGQLLDEVDPSERSGGAIVGPEYGEDLLALVRNKEFQALCAEVPETARIPDDRWQFQMRLNEQCHARRIPFRFIGGPIKAMRKIRELRQTIASTDTPEPLRIAAQRVLDPNS